MSKANPFDDPEFGSPSGTLRKAADLPLGFASGALGATKALSDSFGADNVVSRGLKSAGEGVDSLLTPEAKAAQRKQGEILDEAKGKGFGAQVAAGGRAFMEAPVQTAVQGLGSVAPFLAAQLIPGVGQGATAARVAQFGMGLGMGAGSVKGSIRDEVQSRELAAGKTPEQAAATADEAQSYTGPNADQIALGAGLGVADAALGVTPMATKMLRQALGKETAQQVSRGAAEGVLASGLKGVAKEVPTEFAQGTQEQVAANIAAQRAGYEAGTFDGAFSQGAMEGIAAAGPGAGFGIMGRNRGETAAPGAPAPVVAPPAPVVDGAAPAITPIAASTLPLRDSYVEASKDWVEGGKSGDVIRVGDKFLYAPTGSPELAQWQSDIAQKSGIQSPAAPIAAAPLELAPMEGLGAPQRPLTDAELIAQERAGGMRQTYDPRAGVAPDRPLGLVPDVSGIPFDEPAKPFGQNFVMPERPSVAMGLDPAIGGMTAAAALAVDSGASPVVQGFGIRRAAQPVDVQPITGAAQIGTPRRLSESPIIDVQAREVKDQQAITSQQPRVGMTPRIGNDSPTQGALNGPQAPQAQQAETQRQEAPAAVNPGQPLALPGPAPEITPPKAGNNPGQSTPEARARNLATLKGRMMAGRTGAATPTATPTATPPATPLQPVATTANDGALANEGKTVEPSLDDQLKAVNERLSNQGRVQDANTARQRDQLRTAIAERDFPDVLKAVDGDVGTAEAINQALQFAGDEPRAKVVERVLKNRGITDEYRKRWGERLSAPEQSKTEANNSSTEGAISEKLPKTDIRMGDKVMVDGKPFTVTQGVDGGIAVESDAAALGNGVSNSETRILKGDDAIRAKIEADKAGLNDGGDIGKQWTRSTTVDREGMAIRAGLSQKAAKNLAKRGWGMIDPVARDNIERGLKKADEKAASAPKAEPETVPSAFTGKPDPRNSQPMQELDGFKVGDTVDIPSRTTGKVKIDMLYTRNLAGFGPIGMARVVRQNGTTLDVATSELKAVEGNPANSDTGNTTSAQTDAGNLATPPVAEIPAPAYGADNKLVTADRAAELRERLKKKLSPGRLNSGIDPEILAIGAELAVFHIEAGVRKFSAFAKAIAEDLDVPVSAVRPYLRSWYNGARDMMEDANVSIKGMDTPEAVKAALADLDKQPSNSNAQTLAESLYQAIKSNQMPKDNPALKKLVEAFDGKPADQARMKQAQEELETAIAMMARKLVAKKEGDRSTFDMLLRLYESQPNLNIRTSTSIANQAYSTPAPLAYLASRLAGITKSTVAHEPTAGTGMLLIGADPKKAIVNELNDLRMEALKSQGFAPTQKDAATQQLVPSGEQPDAVVTNPPFGSIKDADGNTVKVKVDGFSLGQIDHLIAARALNTMKQDGRATLILGANKVAGGLSTDDRIFFNWLYSTYNVVGHFEVDGDLYTRQGAGWPVRVITINGRIKSSKFSPVAGTIQRVNNWDAVYEQFTQSLAASKNPISVITPTAADRAGERPVGPVEAPTEAGKGKPSGSTSGTRNVAGAGAGVLSDSAEPAAGAVGDSADEQRLNAQSFVPATQPGQSPAGTKRPEKPAGTDAVAKTEGNEFQLPYTPRSSRKDEGVLIPANMAQPTQDALSRLEDEVGDIDEFARAELGYNSVAELHNALMGLQVDSVATSIYQIKQGKAVVIADQTGIGKGRQAASIIRWAAKQGMTPVFVSVKPSLFTDMYGDLAEIGTDDVTPFIMNGDAWVAGEGGAKLFANKAGQHKQVLQEIANSGQLPDGSNALFMTYSQINMANVQRQALLALAPNAVFVLDESHNAAGASATGDFVIGALGAAKGVVYLSATYAKRPDNMPLYFKTDIGDAAADADGLAVAMASGGLPLQTVVSNNLVKAGQMFRRERSYDGVSISSVFDSKNRALHERMSDEATKALRAIVSADRMFHEVYVKQLADDLAQAGAAVQDSAGNQIEQGVQHTEFSSVVHNFVKQMLLGLKAQSAADEAIASLKRGEKPIIAVENTMGSFLNEYAAANGIGQGDGLGSFDYRTVLTRALARSRFVIEVAPNGDKVKRTISLDQLDPLTKSAYRDAQAVIDGLSLNIPVSPIDWMRAEIIRAGFKVAEITGRNLSVDYGSPKKPVLSAIDAAEQKDKVNTTRLFNSGKLDALILNVAGSTGISLHASEKFEDQRQRHMIVAQAAGDINIFMQMLGRVHRTGQVRLPKYTILSVDLPTEKRPTAVLSIKMKSLNANTSSNTESATSVKTADILNKYGDQIVNQYLVDNLALARALDVVDSIGQDPTEDIARKATGRLALQPIEVQMGFYEDVESQYEVLIDYLNKTNQNDLEPRTFDFDAKETRQEVLFDGPNKNTPFGEDAIYGEYSIKAQGEPMKADEIKALIVENLAGKTGPMHANELVNTLLKTYADQMNADRAKVGLEPGKFDEAKYTAFMKGLYGEEGAAWWVANAKASIAKGQDIALMTPEQMANVQGSAAGIDFIRSHPIGRTFRVDINSEPFNAVITSIRSTHKSTGNPFSLSKIQVTVAVNGALRSLSIPATQFRKIEVSSIAPGFQIEQLFKEQPPNQRETAKIVTGNLLAAYGELQGVRGTIITFTKQDGTSEQGILLPKLFDYSKNTRGDYRLQDGQAALKFLQRSENKDIGRFGIMTRDGEVRVLPSAQGIRVQVPKSKLKGTKYFLDKGLIAAGGDFVTQGAFMVSTVQNPADAVKMLDLLMKKQALYALPSMAEEAKALTGGKDATQATTNKPGDDAPAASRSRPVFSRAAQGQASTVVQGIVDAITTRWANAPKVVVAFDMNDPVIPERVRAEDRRQRSGGATGTPEGFYYKGTVYLMSSKLTNPRDVVRVLFHEALGHFGLRGVFGKELKPLLQQIATMRKAQIEAKMKEYGLRGVSNVDRLVAAEEVLAEMAQDSPQIGFVRRAIATIRAWLRKHIPGFGKMMLTDDELIQQFILPARNFVLNGGPNGGPGGGVRFNRNSDSTQDNAVKREPTETPQFNQWFGGSKVVDADGKPLVVYHGTTADFSVFQNALDRGGDPLFSQTGLYFAEDSGIADIYGDTNGGNVMPVYLSILNPFNLGDTSTISGWKGVIAKTIAPKLAAKVMRDEALRNGMSQSLITQADRDKLMAEGYDGIKGAGGVWIAFNPTQIKSATGNNGDFDTANPDIRFSRSVGEALTAGVNNVKAFDVGGATGDRLAHYRGMAMQTLGRRQIVDLYGDMLPELNEYDRLVQQMDSDKNESGAEADKLVGDWAKLDERSKFGIGLPKHPGMERKLAELMHDSTLAQIDPDKPLQRGDDEAKHSELVAKFQALSPNAQTVYREARDMYAAHFKKVQQAIQDRIQRSSMDETSKAKMIAKMDADLFNKLKGVYFPLARFGKYVVVAKDAEGQVVSVSRAETLAEANNMRREVVRNSAPGVTVSRVYKDAEFNATRDAVGKGFVADLMTMLQGQGVGEDVLDSVGQLYLASMPDLSWAKHGIHRKGTPGFSQDARRAFAQNMFHGARHLAKLRYADQLADKLMDMEERVKDQRDNEGFDPIKAQQVVDEMNARHDELMNPKTSSLSTALTSVGFVWFLGISPASALVNLSQTALVAYPVMAAKWGFQKAGTALLSASAEVVRAGNDLSKVLKDDELDAFQKAVDDGTIDVTQAHDLAGVAQGEDERVAMAMRPVMRAASFMFHHAEKFNRQATFIAAYRLAKESGAAPELAFEQAKKATYDGHFDYSASNRPRLMQGNWQKVLFLFKQYGQNMVYTLTRQAYVAMKGMTPEQRAEARKQLGGLLAMHAMAAGALGLPLVGILLSAASMAGGDDDEPWDAEVALKNMMADAMGPKAAEVMAHGLSRLTPWDLSGRVALNKLILPDIQEGLEGQPLWEKMVTAAAGPVAGIGGGFFKGMAEMGQGQYQRGLESMLPVALKNPIKAMRFGEEGAVDKTGIVIKDEVGLAGLIGQASGFRPSEVALATEGRTAIYQADKALTERRSNLVRQYALARMNDDREGVQDALEQVRQFNEKNPNRRITMPNLMQSVRSRQLRIDGSEQGVYLPNNRRDALEAGRFALTD